MREIIRGKVMIVLAVLVMITGLTISDALGGEEMSSQNSVSLALETQRDEKSGNPYSIEDEISEEAWVDSFDDSHLLEPINAPHPVLTSQMSQAHLAHLLKKGCKFHVKEMGNVLLKYGGMPVIK